MTNRPTDSPDLDQGELLVNTLDHLPVGISIFDDRLRLILSNLKTRQMLDWPPGLIEPGTHLEEIIRFNAQRGDFGPGDIESLVRSRLELARRSEPHRIEREINGRIIEIHGNPLPAGGFITIYSDVTELRLAERASRQSERRFRDSERQLRTILEASPIGVAVLETESERIRFANARFGQLTGLRAIELASRTLSDLVAKRESITELFAILDRAGQVLDHEIELRHASGDSFWALITIRTMPFQEDEGANFVWIYDISEQTRAKQRLAQLANLDDLTGLANRRAFHDELRRELAHTGRGDHAVAVLYLDLDGFKGVNDRLGHEAGDQVLRDVAHRLRASLREGDLIGRVGGDEFATLLSGQVDPQVAECVATKLIESVSGSYRIGEETAQLGVSVGIVCSDDGIQDAETLINRADQAMYQAKRGGKGRAVVWRE